MQAGFGFVIICPEPNFALARRTTHNIQNLFPEAPIHLALPPRGDPGERLRIRELANPVSEVGTTITGLINTGLSLSQKEWNFIVVGGASVSANQVKKYLYFCRSDRDVLFPVVDRRMYFDEGSINGILMHRKCLDEVGLLPEYEDLSLAKLEWCGRAIEKGYQFKAIVGANFI